MEYHEIEEEIGEEDGQSISEFNIEKKLLRRPSYGNIDIHWDAYIKQLDYELSAKEKVFNKSRHKKSPFYIIEKAKRNKLLIDKIPKPIERPLLPQYNNAHVLLKKYAQNTRLSIMPRDWRKRLTKQMPIQLINKWPELANQHYKDIDQHYAETNLSACVNSKILPLPGEHVESIEFNFRCSARTKNYDKFLRRQKLLKKNLYIVHPAFRNTQYIALKESVKPLIDFSIYKGPLKCEFSVLGQQVETNLTAAKNRIIRPFFDILIKEIRTNLGDDLSRMLDSKWIRYISALKGLIKLCVLRIFQNTIDNLLFVLSDPKLVPYIHFELCCEGTLHLIPSIEEIYQFYHNILNNIVTYSQHLTPTNKSDRLPHDFTQVTISLPDFLIAKAQNEIDIKIGNLFQPIFDHKKEIETIHTALFNSIVKHKMDEYLKENHSFDEICEKVNLFSDYKNSILNMDQNVYFKVGIINQSAGIKVLRDEVERFMEQISEKLFSESNHINYIISKKFEELAAKALKIPKTTAELVKLGDYMLWVKTKFIHELEVQLRLALNYIIRLMEITTVNKKIIESNVETLTWLHKIKPILDAHNSMFEQRKAELEDELRMTVQKLEQDIHSFTARLALLDDMSDDKNAHDYCETLRSMTVKIQSFEKTLAWANEQETLLKLPITTYPELHEYKSIVYPFYNLVFLCACWHRHYSVWMDGPWENIIIEEVETQLDDYLKKIQNHKNLFRTKIKQQITEKYPLRFKGSIEDKDIDNQPAPLQLIATMLQNFKDFRPFMQLIVIMRNPALLQRHWDEMSNIAGQDMTPNARTTLRKIFNKNIGEFMDEFEIISSGATKELALKNLLAKMKQEWVGVHFQTSLYKDSGLKILSGLDDIQAILDDHITKTLSMRGSAFVKPIETEVKEWYEKITRLNATLDVWGKVQSQWCYLMPIFSSKDIVKQMPEEGALYKEIDITFRRYMNQTERDPRVLEVGSAPGVLETFTECLAMLDKINDGVVAYLEKKRLYFPRFFFLSNDEMLEILSETKDPLRVQPHLRKCFEGICKLYFDKKLVIHSMFSQEGEKVTFLETINTEETNGAVEKWLIQVEAQMLKAVKNEIFLSKDDYEQTPRSTWVTKWEGQVVLCVSQMFWAKEAEYCLRARSVPEMQHFHTNLMEQLNEIVRLVRSPNISNLNRITIKVLIVIDVHAKDVIQSLVEQKVDNITDFQWLSQLRYYWQEDVLVRLINATVYYAYEYLGNSDRLVITPLTDRCYRTLVGAYALNLNGAPEGPAGTGKTETTKDLAKAIAVQCVVFNCSDGLDYKAMGKFFKGLASTGAWSCFDEFNRIELEVLSVIAQQILCIILAIRANVEEFVFEGTTIKLKKPPCYVCITMNPGYAGRSELPDNLKVLFRTVAMMVPDYALIGEISLYSFGFVDARKLSVKIVQTYRLCSEQLSSQNHYDYGMRAVKTVLQASGNNKLAYPDESEDILVLRAIKDVNLPKFLSFDVSLFEGIVSDLFPSVILPTPEYTNLLNSIKHVCAETRIQPVDGFITKIIQTYEMMIVRHGFMIVGLPFSGKSTCLKVLALSLTDMYNKGLGEAIVEYQTVNPKSVTMGQLYGRFDPISYEWSDGIVATCFRNFAMDPSPNRKWVIFDGPIDAVWIENMNTVLDDNKKLCLMSGEVIAMSNVMSMIFEVMDLAQASPATVSRCGMIYSETDNIGWRSIALSWIEISNPVWINYVDNIMSWFDFFIPLTLDYVKRNCRFLCFAGEINLVTSTLNIIEMLMNKATKKFPDEPKHFNGWFQASLLTGICWGIGASLDLESRNKFDYFHKCLWTGENENIKLPSDLDISIALPGDGMYIDYFYVYRLKGSWKYWPDEVRSMSVQASKSLQQTLVPTLDVARYMFFLKLHIESHKRLLLIGETGTGKTFYTQHMMMKKLPMDLYEPSFITFTVQITANQTQDLVISKLFKLKRGKYGPSKGKYAVIFVDDINLPAKEIYGAQPPIELLRQYFDYGHWYNLKDTTKLFLYDLMFLAAMGPVGGSRQEIYQRFLRHFNIYSINSFSDESMNKIFSSILMNALKNNGFATDIMMTVMYTVNATLNIYKQAIEHLRPTPAKSHYILNLRDFARVIQGCALMKKESVSDDKSVFVRLWIHEVLRVFYDRLVDENDREWLFDKIKDTVRDCFKASFEGIFEKSNLPKFDGKLTKESMSDFIFGVYMDLDSSPEQRRYEQSSIEEFLNIAEQSLQEYNDAHKAKINIVLFRFALEHLSKVCRIISMPCGSGLLVGVGGSGRQSNTKLAAAICGFTTFQPEITKNYDVNAWRDDIKSVLKQSGGMGKDLVFLLNEGQITEEVFLQDIDGLLNSGEVPNIYAIDEKQEILELTRLAAQGGNRNLDISALEVFSFFANRCKEKLHIILCFSPVGSTLRTRLRLYPALINCCTIDWFEGWPADALERVAEKYMDNINLDTDIKKTVVVACKYFHVDARDTSDYFYTTFGRKTYITSASYLDLIRSFTELCTAKQEETLLNRNQYIVGLDQLAFAAEQVAIMQKDLSELKPKLVEIANKCLQMAKQIEKETIEIEKTSILVKKDEENANIQAEAAQKLKQECEADLAVALPVLEEAIEALNTLKPADITLVKSMKNPPAAVKLVMAAVCVMKGIPPDKIPDLATGRMGLDYWGPSKRILGDINFLQSLKDFDKDNIPSSVMQKIRHEYLTNSQFKPAIVAKASTAAEGLCKWIIAIDMYDKVIKVVAPKKEKLALAEAQFNKTMEVLTEKRALLANLQEKLINLKQQLEEANEEMRKTQDNVKLCTEKLYRAEKLIKGLGGEKIRWTKAAELLLQNYQSLAGDILLSCGIIAYLAPFNSSVRNDTVTKWHKYIRNNGIPCSETYSLREILGSDIKIQSWYIFGLPIDNFSTDNAIIMDISKRCSLLIDPQGQANYWIRTMEKKNKLVAVKFTDPTYMKQIEHCIEFGQPVLIENILETLDAPIDPILQRITYFQHGVEFISLGDIVIEMHPKFKLYMTSSLRNPHYLPEIFNKVTLINFSLTIEGLEDQLLGIVVAKERPDLQEKREKLIVESADNKKKLKEVEILILQTLSETKGNILEDQTAIDILDSSKTLSEDIQKKQAAAMETEAKIEISRTSYKPVAKHSSVLYYCISDLPNVDPMYQYSLSWFINLYILSIANASKSNDLEKRLKFLISTFDHELYLNVCRSLFEKDKLLFSFILYSKIMLAKNKIDNQLLKWFLTGTSFETNLTNPAPQWLSKLAWNQFVQLSEFKVFEGFKESFSSHIDKWHEIYDLVEPQEAALPEPWNTELTLFEKLIIIRIIRPDKTLVTIRKIVALELGEKFIQPPPFDIAKSFADSNFRFPLIFILSPGVDPMATLQSFAEKMGFEKKFKSISLGQGQGPIAEQLIAEAQASEQWVCLQNCHLSVSWMPKLEKICDSFDNTNTRPGFRLWLTSYPSDKFPVPVLQNGIKMTNEPPQGLTQNILRSYRSEPLKNPEFYSSCPGKDQIFHKLLYGMAFFHAIVQERRTYGPVGWNISYGFNESDFDISVQQLQIFINEYVEVPFVAILYLVGECNYGGRVTDDWDRRCLNTLLIDFINQQVITDLKYKFIDLPDSVYGIPKKTEYKEIISFLKQMPAIHPPEVIGLHMNAGIRRDLQNSMVLLDSALLVQGKRGSQGKDQDKILSKIVEDILQKLPKPFDLEFADKKYPTMYAESMNTVLCQELERFNKLLTEMSTSLVNIQKALLGLVVMTPFLEIICESLLIGKIPASWAKVSYPSLKSLSEYINDFCEKIQFLKSWLEKGKPKSFWLPGFFFTQAFLTGVKQNYARKYKIAIDQLTFDFSVLTSTYGGDPSPKDGVHCYGMFLEGARWNFSGYLDEQYPKIIYEQLPCVWFVPIQIKDFKAKGRYTSPLYKTSERKGVLSTTGHSTNYVLPILLETKKSVSHWIKRSTALLLQLD